MKMLSAVCCRVAGSTTSHGSGRSHVSVCGLGQRSASVSPAKQSSPSGGGLQTERGSDDDSHTGTARSHRGVATAGRRSATLLITGVDSKCVEMPERFGATVTVE